MIGMYFPSYCPRVNFVTVSTPKGQVPVLMCFIILSDKGLRDCKWLWKNIDDILIRSSYSVRLVKRIKYVLGVCSRSNAKLSPSKFKIGKAVTFGGHRISHDYSSNLVLIQPSLEKLDAIKNKRVPLSK